MVSKEDLEKYTSVMKNYTEAVMSFKQWKKDDEEKLNAFLDEIGKVFKYIDDIHYNRENRLFIEHFDPRSLANSVELVADASEKEREILRFWRRLLINRLNSLSKSRSVIYKIMVCYFVQFLNCLEEHANWEKYLRTLLMYSAIGLQTNASESFINFIQGPLAAAVQMKKSEAERTLTNRTRGWRKDAVRA